jgi:tetratricopeptide (TPR) repeat protein
MTGENTPNQAHFNIRRNVLICLFLVIATLAVYLQVRNHEFLNYDDDTYVTENRHVQAGITLTGLGWAFTTTHAANWHPLTWLSHMVDCHLYGMNPGPHHLTNLFLHIANSLLLFIVFWRMTGDSWRSGFVAALFALHPLHVESVAWVAERKDVLSTFFWMLTLWSYVRYVERPGIQRYGLVLLFFILGLLAKPMLVTLPFVLLLLDYWPLGRIQSGQPGHGNRSHQKSSALHLVWEKTPFFVLITISSVVTFFVQQSGKAVGSLEALPLHVRIANALVSYFSYIEKMIWPHHLAAFYPYPKIFPWWQVAGAGFLLVLITVLAIRGRRKRPDFFVGWLWYTGTLVPVIGLVQVGLQALADRYTYVSLIGIFLIIAWRVPELAARWRYRETGLATTATLVLLILGGVTWLQVRYWTNSTTLFQHALHVTSGNYVAHDNLGIELFRRGKIDEAMSHFTDALRIEPDFEKAHNNLGAVLLRKGKIDEAVHHFSEAIRIKPDFEKAYNNLGAALARQGKTAEAIRHYSEALRIDANNAAAHINMGIDLAEQGKIPEAISHYNEALHIDPGRADAHNHLGEALVELGKLDEAIHHYSESLRTNPDDEKTHYSLGAALAKQGRIPEAISHYSQALKIDPDYVEAHNNLGNALARQGKLEDAISHYSRALQIRPDHAEAHNNLGVALARQGSLKEAIGHFSEALRIRPDFTGARQNLERALTLLDKSTGASETQSAK